MPDPDKLRVLASVNYVLRRTCGNCKHSRIAPGSDWGSCVLRNYSHAKHGLKALSINRNGRCEDDHEFNEKKAADAKRSGFDTFMES